LAKGVVADAAVVLLVDIGNTHTHVAVANGDGIVADARFASESLALGQAERPLAGLLRLAKADRLAGAVFCSVVPRLNTPLKRLLRSRWQCAAWQFTARTVTGIGIDYPKPSSIGADRLANAIAAHAQLGAPVVVVDFGTAVTFDVVDAAANYTGGIIAPGLSAMTDYLHEKTALLPHIKIAEPESIVGKDTRGAMLSGAVHGYRGLIAELVRQLKRELGAPRLPVVATGGYAALMAAKLPSVRRVEPLLTMEGLRLAGLAHRPAWWRT
jgi:type III pantothenate kinase